MQARRPVLYLIACAAPPARDLTDFIPAVRLSGWEVHVIATPSACSFFDVDRVERLTGQPVRSHYEHPDSPDALPPACAILLAPATFNTLNKLSVGITDTLATGLLAEAVGGRMPVVAVPWVGANLSAHPVYGESLQRLSAFGVALIEGEDEGTGSASFPWRAALRAVNEFLPET
jgi:phosphopantothenoylcysteine synthetase/decarboxylase